MNNIQNKVAVITDASSGLDEATARILAEKGACVVLAARRMERLEKLVSDIEQAGGQVLAVQTDVSKRSDVAHLIQTAENQFGAVDVLFANAGLSIVAAALASWLSPDAADQREAATAKRLDRLSRQVERMERNQNILIETLALYVRYYLTVSTPIPEAHQEAARMQGKARFEQFVEQLGRHLARAGAVGSRDVVEELHPDLTQERTS